MAFQRSLGGAFLALALMACGRERDQSPASASASTSDVLALATMIGTSTFTSGSGTTVFTIDAPAGLQAGDMLLATLELGANHASAQPAVTAPAGWTASKRINHASNL